MRYAKNVVLPFTAFAAILQPCLSATISCNVIGIHELVECICCAADAWLVPAVVRVISKSISYPQAVDICQEVLGLLGMSDFSPSKTLSRLHEQIISTTLQTGTPEKSPGIASW